MWPHWQILFTYDLSKRMKSNQAVFLKYHNNYNFSLVRSWMWALNWRLFKIKIDDINRKSTLYSISPHLISDQKLSLLSKYLCKYLLVKKWNVHSRTEVIMLIVLCINLFRISSNFLHVTMLQLPCIIVKIILKIIVKAIQ